MTHKLSNDFWSFVLRLLIMDRSFSARIKTDLSVADFERMVNEVSFQQFFMRKKKIVITPIKITFMPSKNEHFLFQGEFEREHQDVKASVKKVTVIWRDKADTPSQRNETTNLEDFNNSFLYIMLPVCSKSPENILFRVSFYFLWLRSSFIFSTGKRWRRTIRTSGVSITQLRLLLSPSHFENLIRDSSLD